MQTIYTTTSRFVRRSGNLVDLQDYRRRLALAQAGSLAPSPRAESGSWTEDWSAPRAEAPEEARPRIYVLKSAPDARPSRRERRERRALVLDACASLGVVGMTLAFLLQLALG